MTFPWRFLPLSGSALARPRAGLLRQSACRHALGARREPASAAVSFGEPSRCAVGVVICRAPFSLRVGGVLRPVLGRDEAAMLVGCLASGPESQKNSLYSAGAYQAGETWGTPSSSAVPRVMNRFGSMTPARSPRALCLPPSHPRKAGQRLVQRADDERAIPHSRRHSFRRATSHIPDGEDVRLCRLQEQRLAAAAFSMLGEARVTPCVFAGDDESLLVEADQAGDVLGPRGGADQREHGRGGQPTLALIAADDRDGLELIAAVKGLDLAALPDLHVLGGLDAIDEIARHRRGQRASNHQVDAAGVGGEVDHRLSGRVAAANDDHVLARGLERLEMSRRVVETQTLEAPGSVGRQAAIVGTYGENDATGTHLLAVAEHQIPQPVHLRWGDGAPSVSAGDDRAELSRLQRRPLGQLRSG